jgi:hypothetical protein
MGRSGTTMFFDCLGAHPELGWPSQYLNRLPGLPPLAALSRTADLGNGARRWVNPSHVRGASRGRLWPGPSEAVLLWQSWCGDRFASDFLLDEEPPETQIADVRRRVRGLLRWQGKQRFAAKFTGPLRLRYLSALFPNARFLHLIRDPRAVVASLFGVDFWKRTWRLEAPAWSGGLDDVKLASWAEANHSPVALAALQWRTVIELGRREAEPLAPDRYTELRYEDLTAAPHETMSDALEFFGLPPSTRVDDALDRHATTGDMNAKWRRTLDDEDVALIEKLTGGLMSDLGYDLSSQHVQ